MQDEALPAATSLARRRAFIRIALGDTMAEIDELIKTLLGFR